MRVLLAMREQLQELFLAAEALGIAFPLELRQLARERDDALLLLTVERREPFLDVLDKALRFGPTSSW